MKPLKFTSKVTGGKLIDDVAKSIGRAIALFDGKFLTVELREYAPYSSESQREYYFAVIVPEYMRHFAAKGQIYDKEQMHDCMMRAIGGFSNPYVNPFTGEPDSGRLSYTKLTKAQTEGYHTLCRQWAAENGFDIKEPNEGEFYE